MSGALAPVATGEMWLWKGTTLVVPSEPPRLAASAAEGRIREMTTLAEKPAQAPAKGILVTEKALAKVRTAMSKEGISPEQGGLRLGVQGGGCSGLSYNIRFDTQP